jgi:hypothetical protein
MYVVDMPPQLQQYADRINQRLKAAFRPSTLQAHRHAVMALSLFCLYNDLSFPGISIYTLLYFIEFLLDSNLLSRLLNHPVFQFRFSIHHSWHWLCRHLVNPGARRFRQNRFFQLNSSQC